MTSEKSSEETERGQIVETENFGVVDGGDHLKVYRKTRDDFRGKEYFLKTAEVYRPVYEDD